MWSLRLHYLLNPHRPRMLYLVNKKNQIIALNARMKHGLGKSVHLLDLSEYFQLIVHHRIQELKHVEFLVLIIHKNTHTNV